MKRELSDRVRPDFSLEALELRRLLSVTIQDDILIIKQEGWSPPSSASGIVVSHPILWLSWIPQRWGGPGFSICYEYGKVDYSKFTVHPNGWLLANSVKGVRVELGDWGSAFICDGDPEDPTDVAFEFPLPITIQGGAGDDVIFGGGTDDVIVGGGGNDTATGCGGADTIQVERGFTWRGQSDAARFINEYLYGRDSAIRDLDQAVYPPRIDHSNDPLRNDPRDILIDSNGNRIDDPAPVVPADNSVPGPPAENTRPNSNPPIVASPFASSPVPTELTDLEAVLGASEHEAYL